MKILVVGFAMITMPLASFGQGWSLEIIQKPVIAKQLDGDVGITSGGEAPSYPIGGVRIDECADMSCKHVLNSTSSDKSGHFHLKPIGARSTYYLKLTAKNYNPRLYTVRLSPDGPPHLWLEIDPGK